MATEQEQIIILTNAVLKLAAAVVAVNKEMTAFAYDVVPPARRPSLDAANNEYNKRMDELLEAFGKLSESLR